MEGNEEKLICCCKTPAFWTVTSLWVFTQKTANLVAINDTCSQGLLPSASLWLETGKWYWNLNCWNSPKNGNLFLPPFLADSARHSSTTCQTKMWWRNCSIYYRPEEWHCQLPTPQHHPFSWYVLFQQFVKAIHHWQSLLDINTWNAHRCYHDATWPKVSSKKGVLKNQTQNQNPWNPWRLLHHMPTPWIQELLSCIQTFGRLA